MKGEFETNSRCFPGNLKSGCSFCRFSIAMDASLNSFLFNLDISPSSDFCSVPSIAQTGVSLKFVAQSVT